MAAIGRAARGGAIIKGGRHLEALWGIDTVVLDKTGTVTFGDIRVRAVYPARGIPASEVIEAAAIAETRSEHPIGRAIMKFALEQRVSVPEPSQFVSLPGLGVRAMCNREEILVGTGQFITRGQLLTPSGDGASSTTVFVMRGGHYLGSIALADVPRPEAKQAVADMKALGLNGTFSQAIHERRRSTSLVNWTSMISRRTCCRKRSWRASRCSRRSDVSP